MGFRVFIDGQAGTTGLQIVSRLSGRDDIELVNIEDSRRKDATHRGQCYASADLVILCLPDDASRSAVADLAGKNTRILDASSAFRTHPEWVYGLPELKPGQSGLIANSSRVSNPGCYATGYILSVQPLIEEKLISSDNALTVQGMSGYSGGGNQAIEQWENSKLPPQPYALQLNHKHLPEMLYYSGSTQAPVFSPIIANYYAGMIVQVPLSHNNCSTAFSHDAVYKTWDNHYRDTPFIRVHKPNDLSALSEGRLSPTARNNTNYLDLFVFGNDSQSILLARYDNLGKGASGAAVQNMNLMLGITQTKGLEINNVS
jgi:N-acetyl-gamma-glutamyl-phosphate reductase